MADVIQITADDMKTYLGVTVDTYDAQITAITADFSSAIEGRVQSRFLTDTAAAAVIKLAKKQIIGGNLLNVLPMTATTAGESTKTKTQAGRLTIEEGESSTQGKTNVNKAGAAMIQSGEDLLAPYLSQPADDSITSSTEDVVCEFRLEQRDSDDTILSEETSN